MSELISKGPDFSGIVSLKLITTNVQFNFYISQAVNHKLLK
jgi:hypothetical protein